MACLSPSLILMCHCTSARLTNDVAAGWLVAHLAAASVAYYMQGLSRLRGKNLLEDVCAAAAASVRGLLVWLVLS